jgi:hypothetical protein
VEALPSSAGLTLIFKENKVVKLWSNSSNSSLARLVRRAVLFCTVTAALLASSASLVQAQSELAFKKHDPNLVEFTVDVAEDLSGKFVPTFVKPEHTQPERGSFFVTEGRVFPTGTIQGDGANLVSIPPAHHTRSGSSM